MFNYISGILVVSSFLGTALFSSVGMAACELPCKTSKGKMANEWTVSKMSKEDESKPTKLEAKSVTAPKQKQLKLQGGGGGKVSVQDIN